MRLFNTLPPFERLTKKLETDEAWKYLSTNDQIIICDITQMCCDRQRVPLRIDLCLDNYAMPTGAAIWRFGRHQMKLNIDGTVDFTTFRPPTHGGSGWIGENFRAGVHFNYDMISFFNKIDRLEKETCAC